VYVLAQVFNSILALCVAVWLELRLELAKINTNIIIHIIFDPKFAFSVDSKSQCSIRSVSSVEDLLDIDSYDIETKPGDETLGPEQNLSDDANDDSVHNDTVLEHESEAEPHGNSSPPSENTSLPSENSNPSFENGASNSDDQVETTKPEANDIENPVNTDDCEDQPETSNEGASNIQQCVEDLDKYTDDHPPQDPVLELPILTQFEVVMVEAVEVETPEEPQGTYSVVSIFIL